MKRISIMVAGAAIVVGASAAASEVKSKEAWLVVEGKRSVATVSYADLDLAAEGGIDSLHDRVRRAAGRLCRELEEGTTDDYRVRAACLKNAVASAAPQIGRAMADFAKRADSARASTIIVAAARRH